MQPNIAFHGIEKLELREIKSYPREVGGCFWSRDLMMTGRGGLFILPLFSETKEGLMTSEELAVQVREPLPQVPPPVPPRPYCPHCYELLVRGEICKTCKREPAFMDAEPEKPHEHDWQKNPKEIGCVCTGCGATVPF